MTLALPAGLRPENLSYAERLAVSGELGRFLDGMTDAQARQLHYRWDFWRRPNQTRPSGMGSRYRVWYVRAGRGYGKTRVGAQEALAASEHHSRLALIGPTAADIRDVMVEGESGILACAPPGRPAKYEPSRRRVVFDNGAVAQMFTAEKPRQLRGPQHEWAWIDEPASMQYGEEVLDNALLGLRLGREPWLLVTGTPKPLKWLTDLATHARTTLTRGSTYENLANLADAFIEDILGRYEGTRLGRQELHGDVLDDVEGALWTQAILEACRVVGWTRERPWAALVPFGVAPDRRKWRTVIGVDPPGETAECGIVTVTAPRGARAARDHAIVLADDSLAGRPEAWGAQVVATWKRTGAEKVIVESNQGGDMTRAVIHAIDPACPVEKLHAKKSKVARAEPVATMYEKRHAHHLGHFGMLEAQMTTWVPGDERSPDRVDALVHAVAELVDLTGIRPGSMTSVVHRRLNTPAGASPRRR